MIWLSAPGQRNEPPFKSHTSLKLDHAVVMLGAGASAGAGVPVMRGFVDRARDYLAQGFFPTDDEKHVRRALNFYESLRRLLIITEEDVENVETLLSLADLSAIVGPAPFGSIEVDGLPYSVRRFIESVVAMSSRAASPTSPAWVGRGARDNSLVIYDALARAMAFYGDRLTVITLNYDCLLEYSCYCLGIPFTYHRGFDEGGVEILKLHGSINWVRCPDRRCAWRDHTWVPPLEHVPAGAETEAGHVQPKRLECPECGLDLVPVIVPPTWAKEIDDEFIRASWSRAIDVLGQSQALVAAGLSLPNSDSHMRHLLHLGLASGKLIQALVVVGSDAEAAARWSRLFRESWREARLEIRQTSFSEAMHPAILPALGVPRDVLPDSGGTAAFLPIPLGEVVPEKRLEPLMEALKAQGHSEAEALSVTTSVEWGSVLEGMRKGEETTHESVRGYRRAIADAGLAWVPSGEALPVSGGFLNWP